MSLRCFPVISFPVGPCHFLSVSVSVCQCVRAFVSELVSLSGLCEIAFKYLHVECPFLCLSRWLWVSLYLCGCASLNMSIYLSVSDWVNECSLSLCICLSLCVWLPWVSSTPSFCKEPVINVLNLSLRFSQIPSFLWPKYMLKIFFLFQDFINRVSMLKFFSFSSWKMFTPIWASIFL